MCIRDSVWGADEQQVIEKRIKTTAERGAKGTLEESIARWFTPDFRSKLPAVISEVRVWVCNNDPVSYFQSREVLAKGITELIRPQPPLALPTLVITCQNDSGSTPQMSYAIASEITNSRVEIIPELQHLGLLEDPAAFLTPIEDFLANRLN